MERKKILYIHHGKGLGGAPLSLLYLIQYLDKTKYHPVVLFLHDSQAMQIYKTMGIEVCGPVNIYDFSHSKIYWFKWYHPHLFLRSFWHYFRIIFSVANFWLDKIKPDLIHLNTSSLIAWAKIARKKNIPVVCYIREPLANGYFGFRKNIVKNLVEKYSTIIMPICRNDAKPWMKSSKVKVVYNAVDAKEFDKNLDGAVFLNSLNLSKYTPKILFLGGLSQEKGIFEILQIFKRLLTLREEVQLLIAGYFDLQMKSFINPKRYFPSQTYKAKVKKNLSQIEQSVLFLGPIQNVAQVMAVCDVIVFPATVGHFARPIIEAGFMAKPVVASNLPPLEELVIDGKTGFLIDAGNYERWVEKLHALLVNKKLNQQMGQSAYEYCLKNFNVVDQVKKVEEIYNDMGF